MLRRFLSDQSGTALPLVAGIIFTTIGLAGLAIDFTYAYRTKSYLHSAAEAAALSAASVMPNLTQARANANLYAERNMDPAKFGDVVPDDNIVFGQWDKDTKIFTANQTPYNAVEVTAELSGDNSNAVPSFFSGAFGFEYFEISASAIASPPSEPPCIIATSPDAPRAMQLLGNADVDLADCALHVRSTDTEALYLDGDSQITDAGHVCIGGGFTTAGTSDIYPETRTYSDCRDDPFSGVSEPPHSGCDETSANYNNLTQNWTGGGDDDDDGGGDSDGYYDVTAGAGEYVYCNGLSITNGSSVRFAPGVYVIDGGPFVLNGGSRIVGTGVTFFLDNGAYLDFDANSSVDVTAPESGPYEGILFMEARNQGLTHTINSGISSVLDGSLYFPNGRFESNAAANLFASDNCTSLVADTVSLSTSTEIDMIADFSSCQGGLGESDAVALLK